MLCRVAPLFILLTTLEGYQTQSLKGRVFLSLTNETKYYKSVIPSPIDGGPLEVYVRAYVYHMKTREKAKLDITMQVLLELSWQDHRLSYDEKLTGLKAISGSSEHIKKIWVPNVILNNQKGSQIMGSIIKDEFLTILPNGLVILTRRVKASMYCYLKIGNFPFDQRACYLTIESSRYNSSRLHLRWDENIDLQVRSISKSLAEFNVLAVSSESTLEDIHEDVIDDQYYSSITIRMQLGRSYGYYFLNYYLPSVLLVSISWVSFWLQPSAVPARVMLGSATMLTFIQLCWNAQGAQKSSQFMVNDVWALTCTAFIFLSLAEFAFVNTIDRKGAGSKLELKKLSSKYIIQGGVDTAAGRAKLRRASSCPSSPEIKRHFTQKTGNKELTIKDLRRASKALSPPAGLKERRKSIFIPDSPLFTMTPQEIASWIDAKTLSSLFFSLCSLVAKALSDLHPLQLSCFSFLGLVLASGVTLLCRNASLFPLECKKALVSRSLAGTLFLVSSFYSVQLIPLGDASVLFYTAPAFTALLSKLILREPVSIRNLLFAGLLMVCVILVMKPPFLFGSCELSKEYLLGVTMAITASLTDAIGNITLRNLRTVHFSSVVFSYSLMSFLQTCLISLFFTKWTTISFNQVPLILILVCLNAVEQFFITLALKFEKASLVSLVQASDIIYGYAFQIIFFKGTIDIFSVLGTMLIGVIIFCISKDSKNYKSDPIVFQC